MTSEAKFVSQIDHDGGLHVDKINNLMDKNWPPAIMEDGKKHLMACIDEHGSFYKKLTLKAF